jgi:hypothetical protein
MRIKKALVFTTLALITCASMAAHAWTIQEDRGNTVLIKCADGSNSTVGKSGDGWTVISAGKNGKTGGQFAIVGQAAVAGCGE